MALPGSRPRLDKGLSPDNFDTSFCEYRDFTTHLGLYQWKVLHMGKKTSGAVIKCLMNSVLEVLQLKIAVVYINDITNLSLTLRI